MRIRPAFLVAVFCVFGLSMNAQTASGNMAESSNPEVDLIQAQNPVGPTIQGCLTRDGGQYLLVSTSGERLQIDPRSEELLLQQYAQREVSIHVPENTKGAPLRVLRIDLLSEYCSGK